MNTRQFTQDEYITLKLFLQAIKYGYITHWDAMKATTKAGQALPNRFMQLSDQLSQICQRDTTHFDKEMKRNLRSEEDLHQVTQSVWEAQELIETIIELLLALSREANQADSEMMNTSGTTTLTTMLQQYIHGTAYFITDEDLEAIKAGCSFAKVDTSNVSAPVVWEGAVTDTQALPDIPGNSLLHDAIKMPERLPMGPPFTPQQIEIIKKLASRSEIPFAVYIKPGADIREIPVIDNVNFIVWTEEQTFEQWQKTAK